MARRLRGRLGCSASGATATSTSRCAALGRLLFVAFRSQRRGDIVRQHDQINATGYFVLIAGHVQAAGSWTEVGAGRKIQILAVPVERRMTGVAHAVGDLLALPTIERPDVDCPEAIG